MRMVVWQRTLLLAVSHLRWYRSRPDRQIDTAPFPALLLSRLLRYIESCVSAGRLFEEHGRRNVPAYPFYLS